MTRSNNKIVLSFSFVLFINANIPGQPTYRDYHQEIIKCEELIVEGKFKDAISSFNSLFSTYSFVFLRDIKVATQLSVHANDHQSAYGFLRLGISRGWTLKSIQKNDFLKPLREREPWGNLKAEYDSIRQQYLQTLSEPLKNQVHEMFKKDQKKALGALFRIGQKAQDRYAENKFVPHSEKQLAELNEILIKQGYPGERLIGNNWWTSTILSHHNSISKSYVSKDTLYNSLKPKLIKALEQGELSPYELATMEDWRTAVLNEHKLTSFGFIGAIPNDAALNEVNANRARVGMRSIALRNALKDIEDETSMNLYLPGGGWQKGKIAVVKKE